MTSCTIMHTVLTTLLLTCNGINSMFWYINVSSPVIGRLLLNKNTCGLCSQYEKLALFNTNTLLIFFFKYFASFGKRVSKFCPFTWSQLMFSRSAKKSFQYSISNCSLRTHTPKGNFAVRFSNTARVVIVTPTSYLIDLITSKLTLLLNK